MALQQFGYSATQPIVISISCPENVTVYFFDVGQGDSILIKTSTKNVLIDGGPAGASSTLLNYLNTYDVSKIDLLFVTHPEDDHIGGLPAVMQAVTVTDVIYNGDNETTQAFNSFMSLASTRNLTIACRNQMYSLSSTINFTVLNPTQPLEFSELDANSIVLRLQISNTTFLLAGDAKIPAEQSMLSAGLNLTAQVLKVGHHGRTTSSSQAFLSAVQPSYAVISTGFDHPDQEVLDRLESNGITTYGTYDDGTIIFSLSPSVSNPTPSPTTSPKLTPSASPTISPTPTLPTTNTSPSTSITPSPSVPELSSLVIVAAMASLLVGVLANKYGKNQSLKVQNASQNRRLNYIY